MAELEGGEKLAQALKQISQNLRKGGTLKVGFLAGATYPDGTPVAMVAAIQNFGAPRAGIPPRPFFSNMIAKHSAEWPRVIQAQLKSTDYNARTTMGRLGVLIRGQLQQEIRDTNNPPLSPVSLMVRQLVGPNGTATFADVLEARRLVAAGQVAKGVSTKPLIWSAHMISSVAYVYEER